MPKLPRITGAEAVAAFQRAGFEIARTASSHVVLKKPGHRHHLSIPVHKGKILGRGLLNAQIANAGLTIEQFCELLK